jgi:uncharacterized protein YndB with AHSA1/START domain
MSDLKVVADPGTHEIVITRSFDAPRDQVFKAFTEPEARPGGRWRFVSRDGNGGEDAFHGVYHDAVAPERIVYTFEYEGMPGHVLLETITFEERDGRTLMTDSSVFQSVADRDGMLASGMESGAAESMDQLDEYLAKG